MKRLMLATAIALGLVVVVAGLAFANGGPHGGYTPTTDACAGWHPAQASDLTCSYSGQKTYAFRLPVL